MILEVCIEDTGVTGERWALVVVETGEELGRFKSRGEAREYARKEKLNLVGEDR